MTRLASAAPAADPRTGPSTGRGARWWLAAALLAGEVQALSLRVDLPTSGPALGVAGFLRLALPVAFGALIGGSLLARQAPGGPTRPGVPLPPWRPAWPLLAQLAAFAITAALAIHLLDEPAGPPVGAVELWLLAASGAVTALLAIRTAVSFGWLLETARTRWPLAILALVVGGLAWTTALAAERTWGLLTRGTLEGAAGLLRLLGASPHLEVGEALIGLGDFTVSVAPQCSGLDGVALVLLFQSVWLAVARERLQVRRAVLLLPLGAATALGGNVARIAGLVALGAAGRPDLAVGGFHSKAGWVLFLGISLGGVAVAERLPWLRQERAAPEEAALPPTAAAYLAPLLAALAVGLVTGLWRSGAIDPWYGARIAAALWALWLVRRALPAPRLALAAWPVAIGLVVGIAWVAWPGVVPGAPLEEALAGLPPPARMAWLTARIAGAVLVIPVIEELAARGFLLRWLVSSDFERVPPRAWTWLAVIGSSVAFGVLHDRWLAGTLAGLAFAAARLWRGRLGDAILAHAVANAAVVIAALATGQLGSLG